MRISDWSSDVCSSDLIGAQCLDQGVVGVQRIFKNVIAPVYRALLFAFGQGRAGARGRIDTTDAGACGPDALGQIALRHQFQLDFSGSIQGIEYLRSGLARKKDGRASGGDTGGKAV